MRSTTSELFDTALGHLRGDRLDAAAEALAELLRAAPEHPGGWGLKGAIHDRRGELVAAMNAYDRAAELGPDDAAIHVGRGHVLAQLGRNPEAVECADRAIALDPRMAVAHSNRAQVLNALDRPDEALESAERAVALAPRLINAWRNRAIAQTRLERHTLALESYRSALAVAGPEGRCELFTEVGMTLTALAQYDEAMAAFEAAAAIDPAHVLLRHRRAFTRLVQRDFAAGWDDYEARWQGRFRVERNEGHVTPLLRRLFTLGPTPDDLEGRRILIVGEQGVGDEIMFASVLPDLIAIAAKVTCIVDARLVGLLSHAMPRADFRTGRGPDAPDPTDFDRVVALASLPAAFRRSADAFPGTPYLAPRPAVTEAWRERLGVPSARLRIGLSWRGGVKRTRSSARSMELAALRPLLDRPDLEFVSLQYGEVSAELAEFNAGLARPIVSFPAAEIDDFEQLAGLATALDVIVTVQTALAHLTGAIGQRGLVMIPQSPEWRYTAAGSDIPWYGSLRLFRQTAPGGWDPVIARIGEALDAAEPSRP